MTTTAAGRPKCSRSRDVDGCSTLAAYMQDVPANAYAAAVKQPSPLGSAAYYDGTVHARSLAALPERSSCAEGIRTQRNVKHRGSL